MKLRNQGENLSLDENIGLMELRTKALKNNFLDNPKCVNQTLLIKK